MRIYAMGDIHGQIGMLNVAHERIAADRARTGDMDAPVVHLGDLTDRGPDSKGVIQLLIDGIENGQPWLTVKGNHDRMFAGFLEDPDRLDPRLNPGFFWLHPRVGGIETLASYGVNEDTPHDEVQRAVPEAHKRFLADMPLMHRFGDVAFVHAGIMPGVALADQIEDDLLWIRSPFHIEQQPHEALIVHGHTPVDDATHYGNRINLDTGAGYGDPLTVVVFEGCDCWVLNGDGRVPLVPTP
ncbi:MAG: metallophosphoesterase [Marinosulfonomonas sp.]|nr:metallophosphoesterase [Marinosulfonomonas sp.]